MVDQASKTSLLPMAHWGHTYSITESMEKKDSPARTNVVGSYTASRANVVHSIALGARGFDTVKGMQKFFAYRAP